MAAVPADVPKGLVTGQFYFVSEDNVDADTLPDLTVVTGVVKFIPSVTVVRMPSKLVTLVLLPFRGNFDGTGKLVEVSGSGAGIDLVASDSPLLITDEPLLWRVEFDIREPDTGHTIPIPDIELYVPTGATIDLSTLVLDS